MVDSNGITYRLNKEGKNLCMKSDISIHEHLTLCSLFDGSGTFPMAAMLCGIIPVNCSEIEPFPIRVTTKRLPFVKHLGDINHINGAEIEPVDIITFGSPCTDYAEKIVIPKK